MEEGTAVALITTILWVAVASLPGAAAFYLVTQQRTHAAQERSALVAEMERSLSSQQARIDTLNRRIDEQAQKIDDQEREIDGMREDRAIDHALLQEWIAYARRLAQMFREATGQEPPQEPGASARRRAAPTLARWLADAFSVSELDGLAFDVGIPTESIGGDTIEERARELVQLAARQRKMAVLERRAAELRPEV